ncbi:lysosomal protective protein-like [Argonauta hians]
MMTSQSGTLLSISVVLTAVCVVLLAALGPATAAPSQDLIRSLPGLRKQPSFRQYSGYLDGLGDRHLHYWFVESQKNPAKDPVVLWLNGGPGCSSLLGLVSEHGPFTLQDDTSLEYNPHSWNLLANMLYLESPAGVGFSYSDDKNYTTSDDQVALNNLAAVKSFFKKFPEFQGREFYLTGESYGGVYVPTLSVRLLSHSDINFKGLAIGNGLSDYSLNIASLLYFGYYHGLYGSKLYTDILSSCCGSNSTICGINDQPSAACTFHIKAALSHIYDTRLNMYNLYGKCEHTVLPETHLHYTHFWKFLLGPTFYQTPQEVLQMDLSTVRLSPPCINGTASLAYFNREEVRKALNVPAKVQQWDLCSAEVGVHYIRDYTTMKLHYKALIGAKKRILLYNGDTDMACNFLGDQWFLNSLQIPVLSDKRPWMYTSSDGSQQVGGFVKHFENVTFISVRGAGHMVPTDKPIPALKIFWHFLNNKPF